MSFGGEKIVAPPDASEVGKAQSDNCRSNLFSET